MRFNKFLKKEFLTKKPEQGDAVAIMLGRGSIGGIVTEPSKRKSKIRCVNGKEEWFDNAAIRIIKDDRWKNEIEGAVSKSFSEE